METITNKGLVRFGQIMALGLIITSLIAAATFYQTKRLGDIVSVTGSSQTKIHSDTVKWRSTFSHTVAVTDLPSGYALMKKEAASITAYLVKNKVAANQITIQPVSIYPQYEQNNYGSTGKIIGYTLSQQVIVDSTDVDGITELAKDSSELINQGIFFTSDPVEYYYSKLNDLKLDMLAEATKNAKERATKIAESSGSHVASMRSADMGVFQVTAVNSTDISDYGTYDTTSIDKQVMAVVRASFSLR
jgi:hypothetical protein